MTNWTGANDRLRQGDDAQIWHWLLSAASSKESRSGCEACLVCLEMTTRWQWSGFRVKAERSLDVSVNSSQQLQSKNLGEEEASVAISVYFWFIPSFSHPLVISVHFPFFHCFHLMLQLTSGHPCFSTVYCSLTPHSLYNYGHKCRLHSTCCILRRQTLNIDLITNLSEMSRFFKWRLKILISVNINQKSNT